MPMTAGLCFWLVSYGVMDLIAFRRRDLCVHVLLAPRGVVTFRIQSDGPNAEAYLAVVH